METMLTSATGTTPTQMSAPSTFCQKLMRRNVMLSPDLSVDPPSVERLGALWSRRRMSGSQAGINRTYRKGTSTSVGGDDAPASARDALRAPRVAHQSA